MKGKKERRTFTEFIQRTPRHPSPPKRDHDRVLEYLLYRFDAREEGGREEGSSTGSTRPVGFARTVLNVPEETLAIARTGTPLAFYAIVPSPPGDTV